MSLRNFGRLQGWLSGRLAIYPSTLSYIAWGCFYALLLVFDWFGATLPRLFAEILLADFIINLVSPFIIGAGAMLAALLFSHGAEKAPWAAYPFLLMLFLIGIVLPVGVLFHFGGWLLLACAGLFFMRIRWLRLSRGGDRRTTHLLLRGIVGPFAFFAPALILSCLYVGRNTLGMENTDWVPLFGAIYFGVQAGFEEYMLRRYEKTG